MDGCEDLLPVFVNSKDESFRFYIHNFAEKRRITKLIEWCRGFVEEEPGGEYTVELASPGFKAGTNEVFSIEYVLACCAKRKILNIKDFRLSVASEYDDDFNPMDVLQGHISWSEAAEMYRNRFRLNPPKTLLGYDGVPKESTHQRRQSECSNKEHDDKVHEKVEEKKNQHESGTSSDDNSEDEAGNGNKEIFERKIKYYSADEDAALMNFIIKRERWRSSGGTKIWKLMERKQVVPGRTWQSLKERYRKVLVHKVEEYLQKSEEVKKSGMKGADHLARRKVKQKAFDRSRAVSHNHNQDNDGDVDVKNGRKKHSVPLQPVCTCCFKSSTSTSPLCSNSNSFTRTENSKKVMSSHRKHSKANSSVTKAASPKGGKKEGFGKCHKRKLYYQRNSIEMHSSDDDTTWARLKHYKLQEKRRKFGAVNQGGMKGSTENRINNKHTKNVTNKDCKLQSCFVLCDNLQIANPIDFVKQQVNSEHNNVGETGTRVQFLQCNGNETANGNKRGNITQSNPPPKESNTNEKHQTKNTGTFVKRRTEHTDLESASNDTNIESVEIGRNNRNGGNEVEHNTKRIDLGIRTTTNIDTGIELSKGNGNVIADRNKTCFITKSCPPAKDSNTNKNKPQTLLNTDTIVKQRIEQVNLENATSDLESVEITGNNTIGGKGNELVNSDLDKGIRTISIMDTLDDLRDTDRKEGNRTQNSIHQNDRKIGNCDLEVHSSFEAEMHTIEDIKSSTEIKKGTNIQNSSEYCETNTDNSFAEQDCCIAKEMNIVEGIESCTNKEVHNKNQYIIKHCDRILNSQDLEKDMGTDTEMNMMENIGSNIELYVEQNGIENCGRRIGSYALEQNAATDAQLDELEDIGSNSNREEVNKVQNIIKYHDRKIRNHGLEKDINTESELVMVDEIGRGISIEKAITVQKNFENCENENNFELEKDTETDLCLAAENINKLSLYSKDNSTSLIDNTIKSSLRNENDATSIQLEITDIFDKKNITRSMSPSSSSSSSFCDIDDEICMGKNLDGTDNEKSSAIENSLQFLSELFISENQLKNESEINPDLKCQKSCMLRNISTSGGKTVALNHEDNTKEKFIDNIDEVADSNNETKYFNLLFSEFCKSYENESPKLKCCLENLHDEINLFSDGEIEILDFPEESNSSDIIDKNCVEDNDCSLKELETFTSDHSNNNTNNKTSLSQFSDIETNSKIVNVVKPLCKSFVLDSLTSNGKENSTLSSQPSITAVLKAAVKSGSEVEHDQSSNFSSLPSNKVYVSKSLEQNEIPVDVKQSSNGQPQTLESIEQRQKILKSVEQSSKNKFFACESINEEHEISQNVQEQSENEIHPCTSLRKEQEFLKDIQEPCGEEEQGQEILKDVQKTINGLGGYKSVHIVSKHVQEPSNEGVLISKSIKQGQISNVVQNLSNDIVEACHSINEGQKNSFQEVSIINQGREIPKDIHNGCRTYPAGYVQLSNSMKNVNVKSQKGTDHFTDFVSNYFLKDGYCYKNGKKYNILSPTPEAMVISDCVNGAENIVSWSKTKVEKKKRSYNFYVSSGRKKFRELRPKLPNGAVTSEDLLLLKKSNICTQNNLSLTVLSPHTGIQSNKLLSCPPQNISFSQPSSSCEFPEGNKKQMRETVKRTCPSPYKKHHKKLKHTSALRKIDVEPLQKAVISPLIFLSINNFQSSYSEKCSSNNESLEKCSSSDNGPNMKKCVNNEERLISETSESMDSQMNDHNYSCSTISKSSTSVNSLHSLDYHKHSSYCESLETFSSSDSEVNQNNEECSICETGEGMEPQMNDHNYSCYATKQSSASADSFRSSNDYHKQSSCQSIGTFGSSEVGKEKQLENDKECLICMLNEGLESHTYDHNYSQQFCCHK